MADVTIEYKTSAQVAKIFHMSAKRVQQLTADGIIETEQTSKGRRYNWDKTVEQYIAYLSDKANGREKKEIDAQLETDKLSAEKRIKTAKAEIAEMELKELKGKLHRAEDVEAIMTDILLFLRAMLMAMPGKLAVDLSGTHTAPEQAERVQTEINFILNAMVEYQYDPEEYKKRVMARQGWEQSLAGEDYGDE